MRRARRVRGFESLEARYALAAQVVLSEFMAVNTTTLADRDGAFSDWLELRNLGDAAQNLAGWRLTNSPADPQRWTIPAVTLSPGESLVIFASNKNRTDPAAELHANFDLPAVDGYVALLRPDGSLANAFGPNYPVQAADVSFGIGTAPQTTTVLAAGAAGRYRVPTGPAELPADWPTRTFNDAAWTSATSGLGFDSEPAATPYPQVVLADNPLHYWRFEETTTVTPAKDEIGPGPNGSVPGTYTGGITLQQPSASTALGNAARFNGASGTYVHLGTPFHPGNSATVEAWINLDAAANKPFHAIVARWDGSYELDVNQDAGAANFVTRSGANQFAVAQSGALTRGAWRHLVGVYDAVAGTTTIYLDGIAGSTQTTGGALQNAGSTLFIGATRDGTGSGFNWTGLIDEVAIYGRALTPAEIAEHYQAGTSGVTSVDFTPHIATNVESALRNVNSTLAARFPLTVADPTVLDDLSLRMQYDDGFVAYLNGQEVARRNAPAGLPAWNAAAAAEHANQLAVQFETIDISAFRGALVAGTNVLAVQGLNLAAGDADFLLTPEVTATDREHLDLGGPGQYFDVPTPGFTNSRSSAGVPRTDQVTISEFVALNDAGLLDEDGDASDWIELHNAAPYAVDLNNAYLTNDPLDPTGWRFPRGSVIAPGGYLVVFASGKDRNRGQLHTSFRLDAEGEYLALVAADGTTIRSSYAPVYPSQLPNVSYGRPALAVTHPLVTAASSGRLRVPSQAADLPANWTDVAFNDAAWSAASSRVGYDADGGGSYAATVLADAPQHYWRLEETSTAQPAADQGLVGGNPGTYLGGVTPGQPSAGVLLGSAARFDGLDVAPNGTRVDVGTFHAGNDISVEAWFRFDPATTRAVSTIVSRWDGSFSLDVLNSTKRVSFAVRNDANLLGSAQSATAITPGQWHHVVGVFAGGVATVYLDGVAGTPNNRGGVLRNAGPTPDRVLIGAARTGSAPSSNNWLGSLDEIAIYNAALSPARILAHAQGAASANLDLSPHFTTNVQATLQNINSLAAMRFPFTFADAAALDELSLRVKYDDGLVAYLNGQEVARRNAPGTAGAPLAFNAAAAAVRPDGQAVTSETIDLSAHRGLLRTGNNVLAIAGLNVSAGDSDFLLAPELIGVDTGLYSPTAPNRYFVTPTPGALNSSGTADRGPIITQSGHAPAEPTDALDLTVTTRVTPLVDPVGTVTLRYRVMFGSESTVTMTPNGDGTYTGVIPAAASTPGDLVRYFITASDTAGNISRWPLFPDAAGSDQYLGTVVADPAATSQLPVFHWFVQDIAAADNSNQLGTRASIYYRGELYDNVFVRTRGATADDYPKKPYKFDFLKGRYFRYADNLPRVSEINVNATYQDKALVRAPLSFETYNLAGTPAPDAFHVRVERNSAFFSVAVMVEQVDEQFLDRRGLDPEGPLYKFVSFNGITSSTVNVEKKTQRDQPNLDLQSVVTGLALANVQRADFILDNFDVPAVVNYLAAGILFQDFDRTIKNYYLYRNPVDDEWQVFPWDKDLTFGLQGLTTDVVQGNNDGPGFFGHPLFGTTDRNCCGVNHLFDAIYDTPLLRNLVLRRLRTLMDQYLQPAGTPPAELHFERRLDELKPILQPDATLDLARWGAGFGALQDLTTAMNIIKTNYLAPRRVHLYDTHSIDNVPGVGGTTLLATGAAARAFVPADGALGLTWTQPGFNDAAWTAGTTGIGYDTLPDYDPLIGLDLEPQMFGITGTAYLRVPFQVADPAQLDRLVLRMKYDDGFVAYLNGVQVVADNAPASPAFNSLANAVRDDSLAVNFQDFDITSFKSQLVAGTNVLAIQGLNQGINSSDFLIVPELVDRPPGNAQAAGVPHAQAPAPAIQFGSYDVSPVSGNQDEEFLELVNPHSTAVDLSGWRIAGGVTFTLAPGTVIPANGSLFVSPSPKAFRSRATAPTGNQGRLVVGGYAGHLSNRGETLQLFAQGDTIVATLTTPATPSDVQRFLRVTELMYHPSDPTPAEFAAGFVDADEFEFLELHNLSPTTTLHLRDVSLTGVAHTFGDVDLAPGGYLVLAENAAAFAIRYGNVPLAGTYSGNLSNGGETLKLNDPDGNTVQEFTYDDAGAGWHPTTDGSGYSLVIADPTGELANWSVGAKWRPSFELAGSPGERDRMTGDFDADDDVDVVDLAYLQSRLGVPLGATRLTGDLTGDGAVTRLDVARFLASYGRRYTLPAMPPPSPAAKALPPHLPARRRPAVFTDKPLTDKTLVDQVFTDPAPFNPLRAQRTRIRLPQHL